MDIEFWSQHIRSQEKGRLSIKKYCEENKIPEWKFYSKRKLVRASESNFAEVTIMPDDFYEIQLDDFLSEQGVEVIESDGVEFNPNVHEALKQEANDEVPEGIILYTMRRGYRLRDRILRAANVVVSSGPSEEGEA